MNSIVELAKMMKARDNPTTFGPTTGTVASTSPLRVQLAEGVLLEGDILLVGNSVRTSLLRNDEVLIIRLEDKRFCVIDKVVTA